MQITEAQNRRIADCLPRQRGNVSLSNLQVINAILHVAEQGCKWRGLPSRLGNWHTIYTRMNRWSKAGVLNRVFARLQQEQIIQIKLEAVALDSTIIKVHPDVTGDLKKRPASHQRANPAAAGPHQDSSGCRECSVRPEFRALTGQRGRCARRPFEPLKTWGAGTDRLSSDYGSELTRAMRNPAISLGTWF